jgi:hypothetical protein
MGGAGQASKLFDKLVYFSPVFVTKPFNLRWQPMKTR